MIIYVLQFCVGREEIGDELKYTDRITYSSELWSKRKLNKMIKEDKEKYEKDGYIVRIIKRTIIEEVIS